MHIQERDKSNWLRERLETEHQWSFNTEERRLILDRLFWAHEFERFLAVKVCSQNAFDCLPFCAVLGVNSTVS
jgi:2-oxoglutarate dehydrogenase E1 component